MREAGSTAFPGLMLRVVMPMSEYSLLCVDDEAGVLSALKRSLRREPCKILTARSGQEGLNILAKENVDIVISDQRMPGMDGATFLHEVRNQHPNTIRIILSGYSDVETILQSVNKGGIHGFFGKPWDDEELRLMLRGFYDKIQEMRSRHNDTDAMYCATRMLAEVLGTMNFRRFQELEMLSKIDPPAVILDGNGAPIGGDSGVIENLKPEVLLALLTEARTSGYPVPYREPGSQSIRAIVAALSGGDANTRFLLRTYPSSES